MERTRYSPLIAGRAPKELGVQLPSTFTSVTVESPAISVMTDLRQVAAATIPADASLTDATRAMTARNVRMLLVLDADQFVVGLITARDTQGQRPIEWLHDRGGNYADLRVSDLMTVIQDTDTLDLRDVLAAEVGHIIATLKAWGRQHAVVTERNPITGATYIRGIFSATQIGRQLGIAVQPFDIATMFANLDLTLRGE